MARGTDDRQPGGEGLVLTRRTVLRGAGAGFGLFFLTSLGGRPLAVAARASQDAQDLADLLDPHTIPKWTRPLLIPPVMPRSGTARLRGGKHADTYEVAVRQFAQQILPDEMPATTVWGYGPAMAHSRHARMVHHAPSMTIEAKWDRPVRVNWINDLVDRNDHYLPHLLPVDPTLHWANPPGGLQYRDSRPTFTQTPDRYRGPVPLVTHVHGSVGVGDESDGYPQAWYLPDAVDIPADFARQGSWFEFLRAKAAEKHGVEWRAGSATFQYPNRQRATALWYHDHCLGMTRANVYAGPVGFFIIRGGPDGDRAVRDSRTGRAAVLPGPAPREGDPPAHHKSYFEVPLLIQDRSFKADGSLFYPDSREYFDATMAPYIPETDVPPIWNPEFFGNSLMVNGRTWPTHRVQQRRYRFRLLNGCGSRFLILDFTKIPGVSVWRIGSEGGFLAAPVDIMAGSAGRLLMAPAERADVIVDFTQVPVGAHILGNVGPDEPFGGGDPDDAFESADPDTTGQVLRWQVGPAHHPDRTTPPQFLVLPPIEPLTPTLTRRIGLFEKMSAFAEDAPIAAQLGTVDGDGMCQPRMWSDPVTENPALGAVEQWEIHNTTEDAHPIHIHEVMFQVVDRQPMQIDAPGAPEAAAISGDPGADQMGGDQMGGGGMGGEEMGGHLTVRPIGEPRPPEPSEDGWKDTVIAYPGEITRVRMEFTSAGQYVWHCHILEHEDNEMMRPIRVGPPQPGQPPDGGQMP